MNSHLGKISLMESQIVDLSQLDIKESDLQIMDKTNLKSSEKLVTKPISFISGVLKRFFKNKWAVGFLILLVVILLLAIIVPTVSPYPGFAPIAPSVSPVFIKNLPPRLIGMDPVFTYQQQISGTQVQVCRLYTSAAADA